MSAINPLFQHLNIISSRYLVVRDVGPVARARDRIMVNCYPRSPLALAGAALWTLGAVACFEAGRRLSWDHVAPQTARTLARDAVFLQKMRFRKSGGQED